MFIIDSASDNPNTSDYELDRQSQNATYVSPYHKRCRASPRYAVDRPFPTLAIQSLDNDRHCERNVEAQRVCRILPGALAGRKALELAARAVRNHPVDVHIAFHRVFQRSLARLLRKLKKWRFSANQVAFSQSGICIRSYSDFR